MTYDTYQQAKVIQDKLESLYKIKLLMQSIPEPKKKHQDIYSRTCSKIRQLEREFNEL
jgi:hypothetical protein